MSVVDALGSHAWDYLFLHSGQRMSVFNFYLVLVGLLTGSLAKVFERDFPLPELGVVLGFLLFLVSAIFWRMDRRVGGFGLLTYGQCLRAVFVVFSLVGFAAMSYSFTLA